MSHSNNTSRKFDTNFPHWLNWKIANKKDIHSVGISRQARKRQWLRDIEMELSE